MRLCKFGSERNRFAITGYGFIALALIPQRIAEVAVHLGKIRLERECLTVTCDRFIQLAAFSMIRLFLKRIAQVAVASAKSGLSLSALR